MLHLAIALTLALQAQQSTVQKSPGQRSPVKNSAAASVLQTPQSQLPAVAPEEPVDAEARYRAAIALNPGIAAYHESLALVLERTGNLPEAIVEHRAAVRLDSISARNQFGLGSLLLRQGNAGEAAVHLFAAATADPQSVQTRLELANAYAALGRNSDALSTLESARKLAPDDSTISRAIAALGPVAAPGQGYHDYSGFADDNSNGRVFRSIIERVFAVVLGVAALALVAPIAGALIVLLMEMPRQLLARRNA